MHDYSSLCQELKEKGYCAWPNFLTEDEIRGARRDIELLAAENSLTKAGIGRGQEHAKKAEIRGDWTYWFNDSESAEIRKALLEKTAAIKEALNRNLFLGIKTFEGHYAKYPAGTHYLRHSDVFKNTDARVVSLILYLNEPDWKTSDGGQLRVYVPNEKTGVESSFDIDPKGGTLVCFMSQDFEHEVLRANRERFSFTGWFRR